MGNSLKNVLLEVERINEMEVALTAFNSKRALYLDNPDLRMKKIGDLILLIDSNAPNSIYYNRIKGFSKADVDQIDDILEVYQSEQITPCFDMTPNNMTMEVARKFMNKGYACCEQLAFLQLGSPFQTFKNENIEIERVTEDNVAEYINLIALSNGKDIDPELAKMRSGYYIQPNFQNYIVYIDEKAAGMGSLFIEGDEGYIANDFTFPSYRGKGVQKALLNHRVNVSNKLGLKKLYTDVEFGSVSHNNMLKLGFDTVFVNSFWMKMNEE